MVSKIGLKLRREARCCSGDRLEIDVIVGMQLQLLPAGKHSCHHSNIGVFFLFRDFCVVLLLPYY